jgi:metal-dependent amidase/aminoacylase/carboxypeptidase family protein
MKKYHPENFQVTPDITMTSEDFGYILTKVPGFMFWLGGVEKKTGFLYTTEPLTQLKVPSPQRSKLRVNT